MHRLFCLRRSIRKYTSKVPSEEQVRQILLAAMVAPSANSLYPVEFIVVRNQKTIKLLSLCGQHQAFLASSPIVIVIVADPTKSPKMWLIDASLAASHIYLEATNQGLATCWANVHLGVRPDGSDREDYVRKLLNIPVNKKPVCIMSLGFPAETKPSHDENDFRPNQIHQEKWSLFSKKSLFLRFLG